MARFPFSVTAGQSRLTAMGTGTPGEYLAEPLLDDSERELLASLERPDEAYVVKPVEESPQRARAVEDDAPLPLTDEDDREQNNGDADIPRFHDPEGD